MIGFHHGQYIYNSLEIWVGFSKFFLIMKNNESEFYIDLILMTLNLIRYYTAR